ncbi:hypothetical protein L5169_004797 [Vibrio parahaemolyticus]|nr:hypothetical protein [Vibrio parahaemolyticus]
MFDPECTICCIAGSAKCAIHCEKDTKPMKNDAFTIIKPTVVERDDDGYWTHPDLPEWGEGAPGSSIAHWLCHNQIGYVTKWLETDAPDEVANKYFEGGEYGCPDWNPSCGIDGSYLLSIHDTEDGPCAIFAHPCIPVSKVGQLKVGDKIIIQGKSERDSQFAKVKDVLNVDGREEIIINRKKNRYFITDMLIEGGSWAKFVQVTRWA